ncbi:FAD-dependent oxidoreductase [Labilibacter sediminis]|nr:FAD-dependent oxidoreductase [Labilibacter sediminis]
MCKKYLIVGQGLAGSVLAFKMYQQGIDFKVIASQDISKASDVAAGLFNPLVFKRLTKSWMVDVCLPEMLSTYKAIEQLLNGRFLFEKKMIKPVSEQESLLWKEKIDSDNFSSYIQGVQKQVPISGMHAFYAYGKVMQSGSLRLRQMLNAFRLWLKSNNAIIDERFNYDDLKLTEEGVEWQGIKATGVVFCEGYRVMQNPFFKDVTLKPTKGELLEIYCVGLSEEFILNKQLFVMPVGNQRFKIGATYDWKNLDERGTEEARKDLLSRFEDLISLPYEVLNHYAGIRPTVHDRRPVLGSHPKYSQINIFNGLGTKGVMLAPFFASEMLKYLNDNTYGLHPEVEVKRFYK